MTFSGIFLYESRALELKELARTTPINVCGCRGFGKSEFLQIVRTRLIQDSGPGDGSRTVEVVRSVEALLDTLRKCKSGFFKSGIILIDDLDVILVPEQPTISEIDKLKEIIQDLLIIARNPGERSFGLVFTSTGAFDVLSPRWTLVSKLAKLPTELLNDYSLFCQQFHKLELNPWIGGTKHWNDIFARRFNKDMQNEELLSWWSDAMLDVSGGHPLLFAPLVKGLANLLEDKKMREDLFDFGQPSADVIQMKAAIRQYVEVWLKDDGMRRMLSIIRHLRDSEFPVERQAFDYLLRSSTSDFSAPPEEYSVRRLLEEESGLCVREDIRRFRIPGEMLRTLIRLAGAGRQLVMIEAEPNSKRRGVLSIQSDRGTHKIRLGSGPWKVLQFLYARQDRLVENREIQDAAGLENHRALQQAITRLRAKVANHNIEIINEKDKGYRLTIRT